MSASTAAPARSTRSSGRTGPGSRPCSVSPAASSLQTRASSKSEAGSGAGPPRPRRARWVSASRIRPTPTFSTCRWRRTSTSPPLLRCSRSTDGWRSGRPLGSPSSTSTYRRAPEPVRSRSRNDSSSRSSRRCSPGRRSCSSTSRRRLWGRRTSNTSTHSCSLIAARASGSSTSATGCPRCSRSQIESASSATASARGRSRRPP